MRTHRAFSYVQPWRDRRRVRDVLTVGNLVAARFEPIVRHGRDEAVLDVAFARDADVVVAATIIVPTRFVALRESDPLIWPAAIAELVDDPIADAVRDRLLPWLVEMVAGHAVNAERYSVFAPEFESTWQQARSCGFLGAAPLAEAWSILTPYVYARRFARDRTVALAARSAAAGHAALAGVARGLHFVDIDRSEAQLAERWFGTRFENVSDSDAELIVGDEANAARFAAHPAVHRVWLGGGPGEHVAIARTIPFDLAFSFSHARGEAGATLAVESATTPAEPFVLVPNGRGASNGRVSLVVRPDALRVPDGDTDEARALEALLRAEGFEVEVVAKPDLSHCDLVHVIGLHDPAAALEAVEAARAAGVATVVSPQLVDLERESYWGSKVSDACFVLRPDEANVTMLLELLAKRRLADNVATPASGPPAEYTQSVRRALSCADGVLVACAGEEHLVRERFGYAGPLERSAPFVVADRPRATAHLTGGQLFALILGPLEARTNALVALRAAELVGIPLVVAGPVKDPQYAALLHEFAGANGIIVEEPGPEEVAGLLATAQVFVDCAWISFGISRLVRAALAGAAVVASARGWAPELFAPAVESTDPASVDALVAALQTAWRRERASNPLHGRATAFADQRGSLEKLLAVYRRAGLGRTPARP